MGDAADYDDLRRELRGLEADHAARLKPLYAAGYVQMAQVIAELSTKTYLEGILQALGEGVYLRTKLVLARKIDKAIGRAEDELPAWLAARDQAIAEQVQQAKAAAARAILTGNVPG